MLLAEVFALQIYFFAHFHQAGKNAWADFFFQGIAGASIGNTRSLIAFVMLTDLIFELVLEIGGDECHFIIIVVTRRNKMIENGQLPICISAFCQLIDHQYFHVHIWVDEDVNDGECNEGSNLRKSFHKREPDL